LVALLWSFVGMKSKLNLGLSAFPFLGSVIVGEGCVRSDIGKASASACNHTRARAYDRT
jgi:hypothetical protein